MKVLIDMLVIIIAFCMMEIIAWLAHRYVMHGFLWQLHKDHHQGASHRFERNDTFFIIFALPSIVLLYFGLRADFNWMFFAGTGIFLYGMAYFIVHDIIIHQRFKIFTRSDNSYIKAIRWAHKMHHKHLEKHNGESFGMLFVNRKYWRKIKPEKTMNNGKI